MPSPAEGGCAWRPRVKRNESTSSALIQGSAVMRAGRADVSRIRERTRLTRLFRLGLVLAAVDLYLWHRFFTKIPSNRPFELPSMPQGWIFWLPAMLLGLLLVGVMVAPLMSGRSPHILIRPEQIDLGLTDVKGLDGQVDEVMRSLDVFLGYATFREELGGNPRRGILFEGPPGTGKTFLAKAMAKQAGVPFLFVSSPAFQSMWFGMTAAGIRAFFKAPRKAGRPEGGGL